MVLNIPGGLFGKEDSISGKETRAATVIVATDGSGDTDSIQEAVNMLPPTGGVVYIKEGTYVITAKIDITKDNVSLFGAGKSSILSTSSDVIMIYINANFTTIKDMALIGKGGALGANQGIEIAGGKTGTIITGCFISDCNGSGIKIGSNTTDTKIIENSIVDCTLYGMRLTGSEANRIQRLFTINNYFTGNSVGVLATGTLNCTFSGNISVGNSSKGITGTAHVDDCLFNNNICEGNSDAGIALENANCDNNIIDGNRLTNNGGANLSDLGTGTTIGDNNTT